MLIVESLLKVSNDPSVLDVWLTEGLEEAVSGGIAGGHIMNVALMIQLRQTYA